MNLTDGDNFSDISNKNEFDDFDEKMQEPVEDANEKTEEN